MGAYLLVNWDDDNGNGQPDLYETNVDNDEDDLAKIELSLPGGLDEGTLELINTSGRSFKRRIELMGDTGLEPVTSRV